MDPLDISVAIDLIRIDLVSGSHSLTTLKSKKSNRNKSQMSFLDENKRM